MTPKVLAQLDQLDADLAQLLDRLMQEPHSVLAHKLSPERWSAYEVLQHLMLSEAGSLRYLKKKSQGLSQMKKAGYRAALRSWLVTVTLKSPLKFKTPKGTGVEVFSPVESFALLSGQWQKQREEMRQFLSELPLEIFEKEAYRHPRGGMLTIGGMLQFFKVHFERHSLQIARTIHEVTPR
ncbi:DinB family protein [Haliscomenobacter hydrossis]|uniref:DinB-like domain-containing protein n=1 Tax=Haliscomenobacter hydrossis (strain ATCC 27775 / DSM 1100 / LMG 10767 / O) TaxID=760192 RepID=F4KRF7_HALH1|nr:DinB family protein [Haliscomenobacter hydrossis]AEE47947.1 hypothetical protein Halhy_0033 [Haliscomenobacter hydrossis DSM 1100]